MRIDQFISGTLVDRLTDALLLVGADGSILDANAAASRCFGYSRDELGSMNISNLRTPRTPADVSDAGRDPLPTGEASYEAEYLRRDGTPFPAGVTATSVTVGAATAVLVSVRDVTARRRERDARRDSEERLAAVFDGATDGIWLLSTRGEVLAANPAMARMHGYTIDEMRTMNIVELDTPESAREAPERLRRILAGERLTFESEHVCKDGSTLPFEVSAGAVEIGGELVVLGFDREITERREVERRMRASERRYRTLLSSASDAVYVHLVSEGRPGRFIEVNDAACAMLGYTREEFLAMEVGEIDVPELADRDIARVLEQLQTAGTATLETEHLAKNGRRIPVEVSVSLIDLQGETTILSMVRDITDRKRAADVIEGRLRIAEYAADHSLLEVIQKALDEAEAVTGSQVGFFHFVDEDRQSLVLQTWSTNTLATQCNADSAGSHYPIEAAGVWMDCVRQGRPVIHNDYASLTDRKGMPDGHVPLVRELTVPLTRAGQVRAVLGVGNKATDYDERDLDAVVLLANLTLDIVNSKRAEEAMQDSERWLTESQRVAELGHYIFDIEHDRWDGSPALFATLGADPARDNDFATWIDIIHPEDRGRLSHYFMDEVLGKGAPFDIEYRIVRPSDGEQRWVHGLGKLQYAADGHATEMFGIIQDVTVRKQTERELARRGARLEELLGERERNLEQLGRALSSIINVVSQVVETRDPYTAGHQRRVSELAACISEEMGLPADEVEEIRIAALIHDVGKMSVPAEVLSKPGQLTDIEFELIKCHAEAGYRIIASADMEGPTAEIVYQHQERCDGSGYPRGLTADQLLPGAKVIMVADVVEAMSSHRPYRSALGIDAALAEIEAGAGTLYDPRVARSCLRAFREHGFSFSEQ